MRLSAHEPGVNAKTGGVRSTPNAGESAHTLVTPVGTPDGQETAAAAVEDVVATARTVRRNDEIFLNQVTVSEVRSKRVVATGSVTYRIVVP